MFFFFIDISVKTDDFFDTGIMECVKQQVVSVNEATQLDTLGMGTAITFHSSVSNILLLLHVAVSYM
jgi:hypothetical protein